MKSSALSLDQERALNRQAIRDAIVNAGDSETLTIPKGLGHFALAEIARLEREVEQKEKKYARVAVIDAVHEREP